MFNWRLEDIKREVKNVRSQRFTHIQISPIQGTKDGCLEWWSLYQPTNFKIGNFLGTAQDFKDLCDEAHKYGIKIIVDVVLRHVATDEFNPNIPHVKVDDELVRYIKQVGTIRDHGNRTEVVELGCGMPMLDYENPEFQKLAKNYLRDLTILGADMFRLDMAKHYKLPSEGGTFLTNVMSDYEWVGEVLFEDDYNIMKEYADLCYVFTMSDSKGIDRVISAVECHDTYLNNDDTGFTKDRTDLDIVIMYERHLTDKPYKMFYTRPYSNRWKSERVRYCNRH